MIRLLYGLKLKVDIILFIEAFVCVGFFSWLENFDFKSFIWLIVCLSRLLERIIRNIRKIFHK